MNDDKKIDNKVNDNKKEISHIEHSLEENEKQLKELEIIEEQYNALNKKLNKCIELIGISVTGKDVSRKLDNISSSTNSTLKKAMDYVYDRREETNNVINELNKLKEDCIEREKKNSNENEIEKN